MKKKLTKITMISGIIIIIYNLTKWYLVQLVTPFFMPFVSIAIYGSFFIIFIIGIINFIKCKNWKPLVIQLIIIIICIYVPFVKIYMKLDFIIYKEDRKQVIELIEQKKLIPNVKYNSKMIHLPKQFVSTSKNGGDILVQEKENSTLIFFYTYRGILDNFSGFIYSFNDIKPIKSDFNSDFKEIIKVEKNWYYVTSY
ncbi:hypothetical protein CN971_31265 [Bacillus thuringiensis]|uniref:hypothetical protein n=1 Tax=Bacillus thuringiensis TaxID=1428 RepID=UPI000BEBAE9A|nr:hypothetical protein [Bacillus thuringiensis]MED4444070.1 hypothetical protein [Bacillus cereus]PEB45122.1 hypothetical protein COM82_24285 [Bacillus thuringiensis]PED27348.1 hypothetical protein CON34_05490 [Bacillus thuringiensis]PGN17714.1 hypothetical protein CN971_31265 [Bacillus thuringiensis]PGN25897.1 hypothetical protein CN969_08520 [Bacillus thuringiensis]